MSPVADRAPFAEVGAEEALLRLCLEPVRTCERDHAMGVERVAGERAIELRARVPTPAAVAVVRAWRSTASSPAMPYFSASRRVSRIGSARAPGIELEAPPGQLHLLPPGEHARAPARSAACRCSTRRRRRPTRSRPASREPRSTLADWDAVLRYTNDRIVADRIAELLQREGAEFMLGFPENRLLNSGSVLGMRPIIARTERVAVNMADGFARATNGDRLAPVVTQYGPGAEAAFGAVAQAYGDRSPILLLPGEHANDVLDSTVGVRSEEAYRPITRFAATLRDAAPRARPLPPGAECALRRAERPGPARGRERRAERPCRRCATGICRRFGGTGAQRKRRTSRRPCARSAPRSTP